MRYTSLSLAAQTSYAELYSQKQAFEMTNALAGVVGTFHKRAVKRRNIVIRVTASFGSIL